MINLDQFRAMGIASQANVECLNTYEDNLDEYEKNAYTYIPIPTADKYYHGVDEKMRELEEDQYFHPDITMMTAFERLQEHPFLLHDNLMKFKQVPPDDERSYVPDGELKFETQEGTINASELLNRTDETVEQTIAENVGRAAIDVVRNLSQDRHYIITLADANKRRARELFYHAISEFEIQLAYQVKKEYPHSLIEDVDEDEIERWYRAKLDKLEIHIAEHMMLSTLLKVGGKNETIRERFGFPSRSKWEDDMGGLNDLRHKIMHPTRALVHDREDLEREADRVNRVRKALHELDEDQIQPDYPRQSEA